MNKKTLGIILVIALMIAFGYLRDFIFINTNGQLHIAYYQKEQSGVSENLSFLWGLSYQTLYYLKWLFTFSFAGIYLLLSCLGIYYLYNNKQFVKYTIFSYLAIFAVSALFMAVGFFIPSTGDKCYEFSRYLMGMIQTPVAFIFLVPAFKLLTVSK